MMDLSAAKVVFIGSPTLPGPGWDWMLHVEDIQDFLTEHRATVLLSTDRYRGWEANEHHFTTRFQHHTVLPTLAHVLGTEVPYDRLLWRDHVVDGHDLSGWIPVPDDTLYNIWSFTYGIGITGDARYLEYNDYIEKTQWPCLQDLGTPYHKLYILAHTCSKITNLGDMHNGKRLLLSCDSQAIPLIPVLATIYKEVWVFDNRYTDMYFGDLLERTTFDDILLLIGYTCVLDKWTQWNLK